MSRNRAARLASVATSALLALMLFGPSFASASGPGWSIGDKASLPTVVTPGGVAGYRFTITNGGPSNISQLYLTAAYPEVYFDSSRGGTGTACTTFSNDPNLSCALGPLNAGQSISFVVAFQTSSGSSFDPVLQFNTTGATTSDTKHTSHGDNLNVNLTTALNANANFAGTFTLDLASVETHGTLGRGNVQNTTVNPPGAHIPVTIDDSGTATFDCTANPSCANAFGNWTELNVNNGAKYSGAAFKVTLFLYGKSVPSGVTTSDIKVLHVLDSGSVELLTQTGNACPSDPTTTTADCIASVTKTGSNYTIVLWFIQNGGSRGTF